jgi:hypothetical protein
MREGIGEARRCIFATYPCEPCQNIASVMQVRKSIWDFISADVLKAMRGGETSPRVNVHIVSDNVNKYKQFPRDFGTRDFL